MGIHRSAVRAEVYGGARRAGQRWGLTFVEVLVALAIFGSVMAVAYSAIVASIGVQARQEAVVGAQGKLRRVVEVLSQDLRSAVFGSLLDQPYSSEEHQVSFMLLTGGAGYALGNYSGPQSSVQLVGGDVSSFNGRSVLVVNRQGRGQLLRVTSVTGGSGMQTVSFNCSLTIPHTANTLLFEVDTFGISFDESARQLNVVPTSGSDELSLAFDIDQFQLEYVYSSGGQAPIVEPEPVRGPDGIAREIVRSGESYELSHIQLIIGTDVESASGTRRHVYTAQIALSPDGDYALKELTSCI